MSDPMLPNRGLEGLRVLSLESRRTQEMARLIENQGGTAIMAPSMREIPLQDNSAALDFAEELLAGNVDLVIFLTGVGTRILFGACETKYPRERLAESLSRTLVVARGPKPVAALRELEIPIGITVPEPHTWHDLLKALEHPALASLEGKRVVVQEYGVSNQELLENLAAQGALVKAVPVYQWALPEDLTPLRQAIQQITEQQIGVLLITSANQIHNLMQVAQESGLDHAVRRALRATVVASIGPIASEALRAHGIEPDLEPAHSKMGPLVFEVAQKARALLRRKQERD